LAAADAIIATTNDDLTVEPQGITFVLEAGGKTTSGSISELGLKRGLYDARLKIILNGETSEEKRLYPLISG
jgi:hypothetical protein